jgi:hypothetical protein
MRSSSSAATAAIIPTWTTVTCHLSFSGSAGPTRLRGASRHTNSTPGLIAGGIHFTRRVVRYMVVTAR